MTLHLMTSEKRARVKAYDVLVTGSDVTTMRKIWIVIWDNTSIIKNNRLVKKKKNVLG